MTTESQLDGFKLHIEPEYLAVMPRPTDQQYQEIKESIKKDGQLEEIVCNEKGAIRDGHTRFQICNELGIKPKWKIKHFVNEMEERLYAVTVNLKRRHLTIMQRYELVEPFKPQIREIVKKEGNEFRSKNHSGFTDRLQRTKQVYTNARLGKLIGVSTSTINHAETVKKHGTPKLLEDVRSGKVPLYQGFIKARQLRYKRGDPVIVKHAKALKNGLLIKKLNKFHDTRIGLSINILRKLDDGQALITHVALACNSRNRKYDEVAAISQRFVKLELINSKITCGKNMLSITEKGRKLYKQLVKFEKLLEYHKMDDWL